MVKIDKELDTMESLVIKMGNKVIMMHEKIIDVLGTPNK